MKLRAIILTLALLTLVSVVIGSSLYLSLLRETVVLDTERRMAAKAGAISNTINTYLQQHQVAAKILAEMEIVGFALKSPGQFTLPTVNRALLLFQRSLGVNVCYLMDNTGLTIASSNRNTPSSFVGKNYRFRPYFTHAINGTPFVYLAVGVTSGKRGVYYSHPVYTRDAESPAGVVVIKAGIDQLEQKVTHTFAEPHDTWAFVDPNGFIFASGRLGWQQKFIRDPGSEREAAIAKTRQFGYGPWGVVGLRPGTNGRMAEPSGPVHLAQTVRVDNTPGWSALYLRDVDQALATMSSGLLAFRGPILITAGILCSLFVFLLYRMARKDMVRREKVRLTLRRQNEYLDALHGISLGLMGRLDADMLMKALLARAGELVGTSHGFLCHLDPDRNEMELCLGTGFYQNRIGTRSKPGEGLAGKILQDQKPIVLTDYANWEHRLDTEKYDRLHSVMAIPIKTGGRITAAIGLGHFDNDEDFGQEDLAILKRFGELAGIALDNAHLYSRLNRELKVRQNTEDALRAANRELERVAALDGLTQIPNRRRFDEKLSDEWRRMAREGTPLTLVMCDVDYFKRYNDTYGHLAGDDCLRIVAQTISATVQRPGDMVARYGGEEFAILLCNTSTDGGRNVAETIRRKVNRLQLAHKSSDVSPYISLSLGVATLSPSATASAQALVKIADQALYLAKHRGRNRVEEGSPQTLAKARLKVV